MSDVLVISSTQTETVTVDGTDVVTIVTPSTVEILTASEQGPAGPPGPAGGIPTFTNDEATTMTVGTPVYLDAVDGVKRARADVLATARAVGFVQTAAILSGEDGSVAVEGVAVATTTQWDALTGGSGGLTFNTPYYLSQTTAGGITSSPATTAGLYVVPLGLALSTTQMLVRIEQPFLQ